MDVTPNSTVQSARAPWSLVRPGFSLSEERANQLTHGLGLVLSLAGTVSLLPLLAGAETWQWVGSGLYALTLILVFGASTLSHSFEDPVWRNRFRTLDQVAIFLFIAGGFTPFALCYLRDSWFWLLPLSWSLAIAGSLYKLFVARLENVTVVAYFLLGWLPLLAFNPLFEGIPSGAKVMIVAAGICYTVGTQFLLNDHRARYLHSGWHLLVVAGTICVHFAVVECMFGHSL